MASVTNTNLNKVPGAGVNAPVVGRDSNLNRGVGSGLEGPSFKDLLGAQVAPPAVSKEALVGAKTGAAALKFSNHAVERMRDRGISFDQEVMSRIENAVSKAAQKGANNTLLLTDNSALIVSVKNNTVVTVMDKAGLKDNVFTNIDSTVMI